MTPGLSSPVRQEPNLFPLTTGKSNQSRLSTTTKVSGVQNRRLYYGTFHNDVYGTYALCAVPSIPSAIEIRTKNGIILFNYESEKVTAALSTSLTEFVSEKQQ